MTRPYLRRLVYCLFAATLVSHAAGFAAWLAVRRDFWRADDAREQAREAERRAADLLAALIDAETGQRGYLLTGWDAYLEPYHRGAAAARESADALGPDVAAAVAAKLDELRATVARVERGDKPGAYQLVNTDLGKRLMDDIRAAAAARRAETRDRDAAARDRAGEAMQSALMTVMTDKLLGLALLTTLVIAALYPNRR